MRVCTLGEEVLRQKALPVEAVTPEIEQLSKDMLETMIEADGVGLAAPQVGLSLRMFVVMADDNIQRVFINPQIIATSEEMGDYDEGCLSIPKVYETIRRPLRVTVQALNEKGKPFTLDADGLLARVIQHEYDHLDGILYIDRGNPEFKAKTEASFAKKDARRREKEAAKAAKAAKIAAKKARKEAR